MSVEFLDLLDHHCIASPNKALPVLKQWYTDSVLPPHLNISDTGDTLTQDCLDTVSPLPGFRLWPYITAVVQKHTLDLHSQYTDFPLDPPLYLY